MASGSNPSLKRKSSSSSHKKKLSKKSSEGKKRKRSRSRKREKSKKLIRPRDVSLSSLDDGDTLSISSSDSEVEYKQRKGRSRTRGDGKGSKKKVKRSLSDSPSCKKRKRSKKTDGFKVKKKSRHEKKPRKGESRRRKSVDDNSDDSRSDSDGGSSRGRTKRREKDMLSNGRDRYMYRSRSRSSCSGDGVRSHHYSEEKLVSENYPRHLKSILVVPDEFQEDELGRYQSKEEIIQAYDDCPSCKSNDSYDGGRIEESSHQAYAMPDKRRHEDDKMVEDESRKESSQQVNVVLEGKKMHIAKLKDAFVPQTKIAQFAQNSKGDAMAEYDKMDPTANMESTNTANKNEVSSSVVSSRVGDLESILRQKALENFIKFRGVKQVNTTPNDGVKQSTSLRDESIKIKSVTEVDSKVEGAKNIEVTENFRKFHGRQQAGTALHYQRGGYGTSAEQSNRSKSETIQTGSIRKADSNIEEGRDIKPSENFRKFRWERKANIPLRDQIGENDVGANQSCKLKEESIKVESKKQSVSDVIGAKEFEASKMKTTSTTVAELTSVTNSAKHGVETPDGNSKQLESSDSIIARDKVVDAKSTGKKIINLGAIRKSNQGSLTYRRESSGDSSSTKQASQSQNNSDVKSQETKNVNEIVPESPKAVVGSSDPHSINEAPGSAASEATSSLTPVTGEHSLTEPGDAAKGGSEFEQKTMSVMRGGELVQVSYKVYIPKRAPALARRQLKR